MRHLAMAAVIVSTSLALVGATGSHAEHGSRRLVRFDVLQRYAPVLRFAHGDSWRPTSADVFRRRAKLQKRHGWYRNPRWHDFPEQERLPGADCAEPCSLNLSCNLPRQGVACYRRDAAKIRAAAPPTVYAELIRVDKQPEFLPKSLRDPPTAYVARYWFFYYFDDWTWAWQRRQFIQAHEGDWEGITIGLDRDGEAHWAAYNQHCSTSWLDWKHVERVPRTGTHPVAYVGSGSHASYFTWSPRATYPIRCLKRYSSTSRFGNFVHQIKGLVDERTRVVDTVAADEEIGAPGFARKTATLVDLGEVRADWKTFVGRWGEGQFLYFDSGGKPGALTAKMGESPHTPKFGALGRADFWHDPGT